MHLFACASSAPRAVSIERPIHALAEAEFLDAVESKGGMPPEVRRHPELLRLALPALRADFEVYERYRYRSAPPLECPITALGGAEDAEVARSNLEAWREESRRACSIERLPGAHFFLHGQERRVAGILNEALLPVLAASG